MWRNKAGLDCGGVGESLYTVHLEVLYLPVSKSMQNNNVANEILDTFTSRKGGEFRGNVLHTYVTEGRRVAHDRG